MRLNSISQTNFALGSEATITLISSQSEQQLSPLFATIWRTIFTFERRFSRFIPMSELCAFNRSAGIKTIVSEEFKDLLLTATSFAKATNGLYNPFILPALQHAGYKTSLVHGYENDKIEDYSHKKVVNIERLEIGNNWARIPYGTAIDLGGCGKGYLADKLRSLVVANNIHGYWISLSGDVATSGVDELGSNHTIYIQDANNLSGM